MILQKNFGDFDNNQASRTEIRAAPAFKALKSAPRQFFMQAGHLPCPCRAWLL
jgi:hypothetical protein